VLQLDGTISGFQKNISDWTVHIHEDEGLVSQAQSVMATLQSYIQMADAQKDNTPRELGLFSDPSTIRIVLDTTSSKSIQEYLETLVHESLHYQSYVSQDRKLSTSFFEEGLTEYFSRQVLAQNLGMQVNIGYPLVTKLISQMMKKIPEQEFERIYLTKDESRLEAVLNSAYGSTFYSDTVFYFTALFYAPPADALKTANVIMSRIGGGLLAEKDLVSTDYTQQ
jgi:hypothetical protein